MWVSYAYKILYLTVSAELMINISLVPRPFPPPVFDRILYAKTEGEGLGEKVTCITSGRREGRQVPDRCNSQTLR